MDRVGDDLVVDGHNWLCLQRSETRRTKMKQMGYIEAALKIHSVERRSFERGSILESGSNGTICT